jgi:hypothetical protein
MTQSLPLTYTDLVCIDDVDLFAMETTSDFQNLIQDVTHILVELNGSNLDDVNNGIGIETYLSGPTGQLTALCANIENELITDSRIDTCACTITNNPTDTNAPYLIQVNIGVSGQIIGLQFAWNSATGLTSTTAG